MASFWVFLGADISGNISRGDIYNLTNQVRQEQGLLALATSPKLQETASLKLADMFQNNYFAHTSPSGLSPWYWFKKTDYKYKLAGENLAMDFIFSKDVVDAWLASPGHRKNLLLKDFKEVGVAVGSGRIDGRETLAVVQVFGTLQEQKAVVSKPVIVPKVSPQPKPSPSISPVISKSPSPSPSPTKLAPISLVKEVAHVASARVKAAYQSELMEQTPRIINRTTEWFLVALAVASVAILLFNIIIAFHIQYPVLIFRAIILVVVTGFMVWSGPTILGKEKVVITKIVEQENFQQK